VRISSPSSYIKVIESRSRSRSRSQGQKRVCVSVTYYTSMLCSRVCLRLKHNPVCLLKCGWGSFISWPTPTDTSTCCCTYIVITLVVCISAAFVYTVRVGLSRVLVCVALVKSDTATEYCNHCTTTRWLNGRGTTNFLYTTRSTAGRPVAYRTIRPGSRRSHWPRTKGQL